MNLHELSGLSKKGKKRLGRGGKRGTTSGRGTKGQRSRAGHRIRPASRDLILRIPKRRGFRNKPTTIKPYVVDLARLAEKMKPAFLKDSTLVVDQEALKKALMLPAGHVGPVKILGKEKVHFPLILKGLRVSKSVKLEIEKAGGKILEK